ncbi:MAG: aminotransferase class I/II-fold pyridoxal phosphate-dependent enzyme [Kiritimatiellae bacterium]|nr:aminotransferase class I/II-fold pyridoxal phosphate-dependent enzyme [Kiritimatiellia bacterium]
MTGSKSPLRFVSPLVRELPKSGIRKFFDIVAGRKDVISLGIGEPDFTTPWHIREAAIASLEEGWTHYTANLGMPKLRTAIAEYMRKSFHAEYDGMTEVLVTVGVSEAFDAALRAIVAPGDEVIYHEPCFVSYAPVIRLAGGVPVPVGTFRKDEFRVTVDRLEAAVTPKTKALILNFPNNPTGATLRREDVDAITEFVLRHDLVLISDEVYSELTYEGERCTFAGIPALRDNLVFLNGFSKAWAMTGFRLGYVCAPAPVTDAIMKVHQYGIMSATTVSQAAGIEAVANGDDDILAMRNEYHRRRNFIVASLNEMGLDCFMPKGAFYVFPSIQSTGLTSEEFAFRLLDEKAVACVPGTAFGTCGEGFLRCSYATSMPQLKEAMTRMREFVKART